MWVESSSNNPHCRVDCLDSRLSCMPSFRWIFHPFFLNSEVLFMGLLITHPCLLPTWHELIVLLDHIIKDSETITSKLDAFIDLVNELSELKVRHLRGRCRVGLLQSHMICRSCSDVLLLTVLHTCLSGSTELFWMERILASFAFFRRYIEQQQDNDLFVDPGSLAANGIFRVLDFKGFLLLGCRGNNSWSPTMNHASPGHLSGYRC